MLHTLLPEKEKKDLRKEYHVRAWIVFLFMVSTAGLIGVVSLFPTLIKGHNVYRSLRTAAILVSTTTDRSVADNIRVELKGYDPLVAYLNKDHSETVSPLIESVVSMRGDVVIDSMALNRPSTSTISVVVEGKAPTRNSLLTFKSKLESGGVFKVDLPVSELAESKDLNFSMRISKTSK